MSNSSFYSNTGITSADVSSITSAKEAAATSETNAATSATEAANSATQAATSATNAASSETNVSNSAATATTSAANASTSETNASASAATATTQASNAATSATAAAGSASTAGTSATNAASSATNAATSETNAATSETNAANSATSAATSATNAGTSETNAAASASSASGYVTSATTQANNAATSATAAATSETNAASSATAASTSASGASTSASNANTSATNAASSASQAATSAAAAALAADNFDDTYLGSNASDPTTDNDGDALNAGDLHFNTTSNTLKVYNGSAWQDAAIDSSGFVQTTGDTMTGALNVLANVGIGTSSPSANLEIAQSGNNVGLLVSGGGYNYTAKFESSDAEANIIIEDSNSTNDGNMIGVATNDMYFITNTSEAMRITSSGSVGIGTSSPAAALHVDNGAGTRLFVGTANNIYYDGYDHIFRTPSGASTSMTIANSGNVGIGTSSPARTLEVYSTAPAIKLNNGTNAFTIGTGAFVDGSNSLVFFDEGVGERMRIDSSGLVSIGSTSAHDSNAVLTLSKSGVAASVLKSTTNSVTFANVVNGTTSVAYSGTATNHPYYFMTNSTERMRIDSSGRVGIGTSSPQTSTKGLHVVHDATEGTPSFPDGEVIIAQRNFNSSQGCHIGIIAGSASESAINFGDKDDSDIGNISYNHSSNSMQFVTNTTEAMRIDSSGNLIVGDTSAGGVTSGGKFYATPSSGIYAAANADNAGYFNRNGGDGSIVEFRAGNAPVGSIGTNSGHPYIGSNGTGGRGIKVTGSLDPANNAGADNDNAMNLGKSSVRWSDAFITNGVTTGSDGNDKQDIRDLTEAEQRVAVACKGLLKAWRWKDAVAAKDENPDRDDKARIHVGIIAQDLQAAFAAEGLDASRYAMFMSDTWTDEETGEERTRMGVRYSELLAFIIAAI